MNRLRLIAGGCAALGAIRIPSAAGQSRPLLPINVGISPIESYGEALYAQAEGFFVTAACRRNP